MRFLEKRTSLRDGRECVLRSPEASEAKDVLQYLYKTSEETHFLTRYPEELLLTVEQEWEFLENINAGDNPNMIIAAMVDGEIAGLVSVDMVRDRIKMRHRASLGLAVVKKYWGIGLGNILTLTALREARNLGYYQLELEVFADNKKAVMLYGKMGFETWGMTRNAFRLKDGTMIDGILMGKVL